MCCLIKYIHRNYFTYNKISEFDNQSNSDIINKNNYNNILLELSKQSIIKYVYMKDNISGLLLIKYTELNFIPLYETIRNHPLDHGYGDFETKIISLYNDMIKRENIINLLKVSNHWYIPKDISMYICKIYWTILK